MDAAVLLTGATGYIGGRLLRHFEEAGRPVRCLARNPERVQATRSTTEVVQGDCLDEESLDLALAGVDSAYYLVHSMSVGRRFRGGGSAGGCKLRPRGGSCWCPAHHLSGRPGRSGGFALQPSPESSRNRIRPARQWHSGHRVQSIDRGWRRKSIVPNDRGASVSGVSFVGPSVDADAPGALPDASSFARPKSSSFTPDLVSITLPGFRSRCTTPRRCASFNASAISIAWRSASSRGRGERPARASRAASVSPSRYSITRKSTPS
jgi:NmrA-like family